MTKGNCVEVLQSIKFMLDLSDYSDEVEEALDTAIEEIHKGGYEAGYMKGFRDGMIQRQKVRED